MYDSMAQENERAGMRGQARQALMHLSQLTGYVKTDEGWYHLRAALSYQISLLSTLEGFADTLDLSGDAALIVEEGYLGYKKLLSKYGLQD